MKRADHDFWVAVQWHPEARPDVVLFTSLIDGADPRYGRRRDQDGVEQGAAAKATGGEDFGIQALSKSVAD